MRIGASKRAIVSYSTLTYFRVIRGQSFLGPPFYLENRKSWGPHVLALGTSRRVLNIAKTSGKLDAFFYF